MLNRCQIKQEKEIGVWRFNDNGPQKIASQKISPWKIAPQKIVPPTQKIATYENCPLLKYPPVKVPFSERSLPPPLKLHPRKLPLRKLNSRKLSPLKVLPPSWLFQAPIKNNKMNLLIKIATIVMGNWKLLPRWEKCDVFFFRSKPCLFLEEHQVNCSAAQMFFLNENFWKNI